MDPSSRVELPPRGTDLSFLSNNPETDTPSRWLTFNSTPNGNTTPGTAFGSPFWGSLAAANGQGSSSTPTHGAFAASVGGAGNGKNSPKSYSPSKEFNPFELSFFPKHNEHLLASKEAGGQNNNNAESKTDAEVKLEDGDDADNVGNGSLSSSVSSLKRPFQDAVPAGQSNDSNPALSTLQSDAASRPPLDDSGLPLPSWKRPKIEDLHNAAPVSSDHSSTAGSASIYAPSPSATLNMNASPDSGSPASSMVPTPSLQSAILPPNATAGAAMVFGNAPNQQQLRKTSIPPEQIEAAKLGQAQAGVNGLVTGVNPLPLHPHQMQAQYNTAQHGIITQTVPPPMNSAQFGQHHPHHHTQASGHPYGYSGYVQQMQHQQQQQQAQPVILPPKTLQQAQAQQRLSSPVTSNPPHSARQGSSDLNANNNKADQRQQSPASTNQNNTAIPYANGRGPARPARTTRSSHSAATAAAQARRGSTAPANEEQNGVKGEEEDAHMYDSSSGGAGAQNTSYNTAATASAGGNKNSSSKKGKKNQASENARAGSAGAGGSNGKKGTASTANVNANTSVNGTGAGGDPGEDEDEGDDEQKRKAFLERNRQAACRSRQKKKEWINNLETHAARLQSENQALASEIDVLRKELFALRHTLSFHERCGCTANAGNAAPQQQQQQPQHQQAVPPPSAPLQVQQQPRPEWRQQQQQPQQPPHSATYQQQQQQQPPTSTAGQYQQHMSQAPVIVQTHASPQSHPSQLQGGHPPPPVHIQTQPQPMTARAPPQLNAGPTLAPSALQGINLQVTQPSSQDQHMSSLSSSQRAPPKLNLSPSSLKPQSGLASLGPGPQQQAPSQHQLGTSSDINRPGSAGARFGLATPNFADLFNGAMGKLGNGGTTPAFGAGLLFTPGGIMSSGGMLGGNSASNAGYNMSPDLPNTFGLSMQDIPIRPASAPPTPSPALDNRLLAPSQDYFSSKNMSSNIGTSAAFADFLAAYNPANLHSNNTGSVLA